MNQSRLQHQGRVVVALAAQCGVVRCPGRPLACLQGETVFSVALRAARQVSGDFLTRPDSKPSAHRLVNSCSRESQQDNTQFRGLEAKSQGLLAFFLLSFLFTGLSFFRDHFLSSLKGTLLD